MIRTMKAIREMLVSLTKYVSTFLSICLGVRFFGLL
jgi:hypothetical protein